METLKERVRRGYSRSWVVKKYSVLGLWDSEEAVVMDHWPQGGRVLDIGCGAGRTTVPLGQMGFPTVGVDISYPMVHKAHRFTRRMGLDLYWSVADAADLPFRSESFDGILFSYNGIELVPGIEGKAQVIEEAWRLLRPGGVFVFTTHALEAFNRFAPYRVRRLVRFWLSRILRLQIAEMEVGEIVYDPDQNTEVYYMQVISPRVYRRLLRLTGFELDLYNSRRRIERGKPPRWYVDFDPDFKVYAARKPSGQHDIPGGIPPDSRGGPTHVPCG
jgi:SAM-dependent methyltransferase